MHTPAVSACLGRACRTWVGWRGWNVNGREKLSSFPEEAACRYLEAG